MEKDSAQDQWTKQSGSLHWFHWVIIGLSLVLTFFAWFFSQKQLDQKNTAQFHREAERIIDNVLERMDHYEDALWAGVAIIQANGGSMNFPHWQTYVNNLDIITKYPGINGLGVIYMIKPNELKSYLANQRKYRPHYNIHPAHKENMYLPITYIIPVKENKKAVGLDMAHENNRFSAALKARDTGLAQVTKPITLVQDQEKTPGFLFYAPFYRGGEHASETLRQKTFLGMVYAPFTFKKLIGGILSQEKRTVSIKVSDGDDLLYNELTPENEEYNPNTAYKLTENVSVDGSTWTFDIEGSKSFEEQISNAQPITILVGGIIIDALLIFLFFTISRSSKRANNHAEKVTEKLRKKTENLEETKKTLEKIAHFDATTKLPNRYSFNKHLEKLISNGGSKNKLMVCILDIDNFKAINDVMGYNQGDELLKAVPKLISTELQKTDYLARLTSNEFGIIMSGAATLEENKKILAGYIKAIKQPVKLGDNELNISASIGAVIYPTNADSAEELIKNAEIAMYNAKEKGKSRYAFFDEETKKQIRRHHAIETALHNAIQNEELHLLYQPQVEASTGKIFGVEALLRWEHGKLKQTEPGEFIPIAEESGLIVEIGKWVLEQVARDFATIQRIKPDMKISVNVSIKQLEHPHFESQLLAIIQRANLNPQNIALEVTETALMKHPGKISDLIKRLNETGFSFALDDFGTGYSSMNYLKNLAISYIKIDQGFVRDIDKDGSDKIIVNAIIKLANSLNAKTIAEGVETKEEYDTLQSLNCDFMQGYYMDKPMKIDALVSKYSSDK